MLRNLAKYLLPHGVVEIMRNRRALAVLGRPLAVSEWLTSDHLVWETEESSLALLPPGCAHLLRYIVDVGANEGQWAAMMLDILRPAKAIVIEPVPAAFAKLKENIRRFPNVELKNVAVGDRNGTVKMKITADTKGASVLQPKQEMKRLVDESWRVTEELDCPIETLDRLTADLPEVSLLKIDVQGFEQSVLAGAEQTLKKTRFLLIELNYMRQYEQGSWFGDLHELLTNKYNFFLSNLSRPIRFENQAVFSDGLYVNRSLAPPEVFKRL